MRIARIALTSAVLVAFVTSVTSSAANASIALFFTDGLAALSYIPVPAIAAGAALSTDPITGRILAGTTAVVAIGDPSAGTFYSGSFSQHYDPALMQLTETGWLGSWGANPALPAPPVDKSTWTNPQPLNLQGPSALLSTTVDTSVPGIVTTTFDWGPNGHAVSDAAFNMEAAVFTLKHDAIFTFLGDGLNGQPPAGANFYLSTSGILCSPPNSTMIGKCGEPTTAYYMVSSIPEPSSLVLFAVGLAGLFCRMARLPHPAPGSPLFSRIVHIFHALGGGWAGETRT
jgi:hypothetical protein